MADSGPDPLAEALALAHRDVTARDAFLAELIDANVLIVLNQAPGEGAAAPWNNLTRWKHQMSGQAVAVIFTHASHFPYPLPPPAVMVRVPMRELLAIADFAPAVINALSPSPWPLTAEHVSLMRRQLHARGLGVEQPSQGAPWAFRYAPDEAYPIAVALVIWFNQSGRVDRAYMYMLERTGIDAEPILVVAVDEPADRALARDLQAVARKGGAPNFTVRFLVDEPTHQAAIARMELEPFYVRPMP